MRKKDKDRYYWNIVVGSSVYKCIPKGCVDDKFPFDFTKVY